MQLNLTCLYSKDLARNKQQLRSWVDPYFRLGINDEKKTHHQEGKFNLRLHRHSPNGGVFWIMFTLFNNNNNNNNNNIY